MFADACEKMMKCTRPVIASTAMVNGTISSSVGSFVVVNPDGWFITAAHVVASLFGYKACVQKMAEVDAHNAENPNDIWTYDPEWIKAHSFWWSWEGVACPELKVNTELDLAAGRFINFNKDLIKEYPTFTDPSKIKMGTSVCRLGFPFVNVLTGFDEEHNSFTISKDILPIPFFPNDGITTRIINNGKTTDQRYDRMFLETSTPGLRGQSGGPIFDKRGHIMGIQSRTMHLDLGYNIRSADGSITEHQYLNVGVATHIKSVLQFMDDLGIKYKSEADDDGYRIID